VLCCAVLCCAVLCCALWNVVGQRRNALDRRMPGSTPLDDGRQCTAEFAVESLPLAPLPDARGKDGEEMSAAERLR
jgi:hypothetical protein